PAFPDMLKQLTPQEAQFLDSAYDEVVANERSEIASRPLPQRLEPPQPVRIGRKLDFRVPRTMILIHNLERMMLVTRNSVPITQEDQVNTFSADNHLYLTSLGRAFILACRMPGR